MQGRPKPMSIGDAHAPLMPLGLFLFGVSTGSDGSVTGAEIGTSPDDRREYAIGDRIGPDAVLARIEAERVEVVRGSVIEWLPLVAAAARETRSGEALRRASEARHPGESPFPQGRRHTRLRTGSPVTLSRASGSTAETGPPEAPAPDE